MTQQPEDEPTHRRRHRHPDTTHPTDYEVLRHQATELRRAGLSRRAIRDRLHIHNNDLLNRLLHGEPPPEWTKRPNAKDELRQHARELRTQGWTYDQIELELGVSRSSVSLWVRDLPKPPPRSREQAQAAARRGWEATLNRREQERQRVKDAARTQIGELSDRELFLLGVGLYWAEGSKSKPHRRDETVVFVNSDPDVIRVYLAWLRVVGVGRDRLGFRVSIHELADVAGAERYWAELVGVEVEALSKTSLKKHNPRTVRKNVGEDYHGCLVVRVRQATELYRCIEGWWKGIAADSTVRLR